MRCLILLIPFVLHSQPKLTLTGPAVRSGSPLTVTVTLAGGEGIAALQWFIPASPGMVVAPGASAVGKTVTCATVNGLFGCVAAGGGSTIPDGVLATVTFPGPVAALSLPLTGMLASNPAGDSPGIVIASGTPYTSIPLISPCDLNGDGKVDTLDVRNVVDQIEGVIPAVTDLNGDGKTNVIDLQRVVNATVDGVCRLGA